MHAILLPVSLEGGITGANQPVNHFYFSCASMLERIAYADAKAAEEFLDPSIESERELPALHERVDPDEGYKAHLCEGRVKAGQYTNDTEMSIAVARAA